MATEGVTRKLAAIVAADIVGYSRLMETDEAGTLAQLKALRKELIDPKISEHKGRIVKTTGDGILIEFGSVTDAVTSAVEIQEAMAQRNESVPADRRIQFRVGVNLGEIIIEGDDIYGTGVNVASRLEAMAEPGGICVSGSVYDQIQSILSLGYEDQGEQTVKNISKPVRSYAVRLGGAEPKETRAHQPAKRTKVKADVVPSIAVLPFKNMSADQEQEFFADGISEDIITALSKISGLFVIARNASFAYKNKPVEVGQIGRELDVRYVLEGSVRRGGDKVRITAQLVDATTGQQVWGARFDRDLTDVFALQDEITSNVVTALHVRLVEGEQARVWHKSTENLAAWECLMQGLPHFRQFTKEDNTRARSLFERSVQLDVDYAAGWVWLGWTFWADARFLWTGSPTEAAHRALELAEKAVGIDEALADGHSLLGAVHLMQKRYDEAVGAGERAVSLEPNGADATALLAMTLNWSGRPEEAEALVRKAMRLSPGHSPWHNSVLAHASRLLGRYDEAIQSYQETLERNPNHIGPHIGLTSCFAEMGRLEEARVQAKELLKISPSFSLKRYAESLTYRNPEHSKRSLEALRLAGLPE